MIELVYSANEQRADVRQRGIYISNTQGALETAVIVSLLSDSDWWAGSFIGSQLPRFIERGKLDNRTVKDIQQEATKALQWMIDDKVAKSVTVSAQRIGTEGVAVECVVTRFGDGEPAIVKIVWEAFNNGI
jgi:phage gp46-like protein